MSFEDLDKIESKELVPGFFGKFIHSDNMTIAYWKIKAGSTAPVHKHVHEQIAIVIEGEFEFILDKETKLLTPGTSVIIPSNVQHGGTAKTDCYLIDIFHPVREDFK
ncbi:MAG: cupin domain-containing protein [Asgard group archaeon]|nr:cupin domain-containing protein [Asgard group archaeon]